MAMFPSSKNQSIDSQCKSFDWFLHHGSIAMKKANQSSKKSYAKYGKCIDLQTYFSEKNVQVSCQLFRRMAVPKSQGNRFVLNNMIGCDYLTAICYRNISAFHTFQYNIHALNISTAADRNRIAILYFLLSNRRDQFLPVLQNIYQCHLKFGNICFFKVSDYFFYSPLM